MELPKQPGSLAPKWNIESEKLGLWGNAGVIAMVLLHFIRQRIGRSVLPGVEGFNTKLLQNLSRSKTADFMDAGKSKPQQQEKEKEMSDTVTASGTKPPEKSLREFKEVSIHRHGDRIVIPEGMSYKDARDWLEKQELAEEKKVAILDVIQCYPLDGIVSLMIALRQIYGFATLQNTPMGFFGERPPMLIQVPLANGKFETAVMGRIAIPKWEGGFIETVIPMAAELIIRGEIKRKFEPEVKRLIMMAREISNNSSIYKGQACRIDLAFMRGEDDEGARSFEPINDAPKFMDVANLDENSLILNPVTEFELRANIYTIIEQTEACIKNGIPLKHGALFMGTFGTGKTLTASVIAKKCIRNGWTFLYLKDARDLANALRLAQLYAPSVVFAEDIDQVTDGERDADLNELLNTMDGVDTKGKPIVTILTTNNPEAIEPAFLRAGRIDTVISMDAPDAATSKRFIERFARDDDNHSLLAAGTDLAEAGEELAGFVPAFIAEAVQKAKRFALHREGSDIRGKLTGTDIALAAKALKKHAAMVNRPKDLTDEEILARNARQQWEYWRSGKITTGKAPGKTTAETA